MNDIYEAPLLKRVIAGLLDFIVVVLLAISTFMLLANGAIDIGFHNIERKQKQYKLQEESSLFKVTYNKNDDIIGLELLEYNTKEDREDFKFLKAINDYYFTYLDKEDKTNKELNINYFKFDENTLENNIYKINSIDDKYEDFILKVNILDQNNNIISNSDTEKYNKTIKDFFLNEKRGIYHYALTDFTSSIEFKNIMMKLNEIERYEVLISTLFSSIIFLVIPALINKNGETAFMHIFKLGYSDSYGYKIKFKHKIFRALSLMIIYTASAYLYLVPLIINYLVVLFNKNRRSLMDFSSNTVAIDLKTSVLFASKEEMDIKTKKD